MTSAQNEYDTNKIIMACCHAAKTSGEKDLHAVLKNISKSPTRPSKIRELLNTSTPIIKKKTLSEALRFILDNSLSKVYTNMRLKCISSGADIWPPY